MAQALGRVVDASALDACLEPRGRLVIEVPADWLGGEVIVVVPSRLACARCDGGGCDGCHRRGGHRIEGDAAARSVRLQLPSSMDGAAIVRLVDPFGHVPGAITQLHLETRIAQAASADVTLCVAKRAPSDAIVRTSTSSKLPLLAYVLFMIVTIATVVFLSTKR